MKSAVRTAEQTDIARFWTVVGPASWDPVLRAAAAAPGRTVLQNARLFSLAEMAAADAYIAVFDAKYVYNFWRPITAIRNGDLAGAGPIGRVADWEPVVSTPLHPEYPCAHCITSAAIAAVLEAEFGARMPELSLTARPRPVSSGAGRRRRPSATRSPPRASTAASTTAPPRSSVTPWGRQIGELAVQRYLRPAR